MSLTLRVLTESDLGELRAMEAVRARVESYLLAHRIEPPGGSTGPVDGPAADVDGLAAEIFRLFQHRDFCYLSKTRSAAYRDEAIPEFRRRIVKWEPIQVFLDIGGGYRASLQPRAEPLRFAPGLGEWFILSQIARFGRRLCAVYSPGARFHLVVDNLCALAVNDVDLASTAAYIAAMRNLIADTGMDGMVSLLAESEVLDTDAYLDAVTKEVQRNTVAALDTDVENVSRFLGYPCSAEEARHREARYRAASEVTERSIAPYIDGLRMTQRATPSTLCFRPFPSGDSRIQAGEVMLSENGNGKIVPRLLTSATLSDYKLINLEMSSVLPASVSRILFAPRTES